MRRSLKHFIVFERFLKLMKPGPGHIICLVGVIILLSVGVQAQEAYPMEGASNERDATYTPVDGETGSHLRVTETQSVEYAEADTSRYSGPAAVRAGTQRDSEKESAAEGGNQDSVLGFNFLYYIIQKFKMSDIVEK